MILTAAAWDRLIDDLPDSNDGDRLYRRVRRLTETHQPEIDIEIELSELEYSLFGEGNLTMEENLA